MRRAITVAVLLLGAGIFSYFQFRPQGAPPLPPPEQLVELDASSPVDRALATYIAAVQKAGICKPGNKDSDLPKDTAKQAAAVATQLTRFDARLPLLAAAAREPLVALQAYAQTVQRQEQAVIEKLIAAAPGKETAAEKTHGFLLSPVLTLMHGFFSWETGTLLLVDATVGKPAVLKKTERDGEVLYRLRWRQTPADIHESLILVKEEDAWKVLTPGRIRYGINSIAPHPQTGQGGENSLKREDKDWRAADFRQANTELAAQLRDMRAALEELVAGKITAVECGKRLTPESR